MSSKTWMIEWMSCKPTEGSLTNVVVTLDGVVMALKQRALAKPPRLTTQPSTQPVLSRNLKRAVNLRLLLI